MKQPPRDAKAGIFSGGVGFDIACQGLLVAILTLAAYLIGHYMETGLWRFADDANGMTMAFLTLSMAEIAQSFNVRSWRGSIFRLKKQNLWLWGAAAAALTLTTIVIYVPVLSSLFGFSTITLAEYTVSLVLALCVVPLIELVKWVQRGLFSQKPTGFQ